MSVTSGVWWEILKPVVWVIGIIVSIVVIGAVLVVILSLLAVESEAADLPEYANLTFKDQADLDEQVDSVLAVCKQKELYSDSALTGYHRLYYGSDTVHFAWYKYQVTCRRFAGLTIMWMPEEPRPGIWTYPPVRGHARIYWWEVEE